MKKENFDPEQYTKYERARILGARALQISANAPILLKMTKENLEEINYDPIKIAELEFEEGILPITVKRPLPKKIEKKKKEKIEPETEIEIVKKEEKVKEVPKGEEMPEEKAIVEEAEEKEREEEESTEEEIAEEIESAETEEKEEELE